MERAVTTGEEDRVGRPSTTRRRRLLLRRLGAALMVASAALVFGAWFLSDDLHCEAEPGDSNFGEAEWSWVPLGTTCRWTEERNGFDRVEEPGWAPTILVGGLFLTGLALVWSTRTSPSDSS